MAAFTSTSTQVKTRRDTSIQLLDSGGTNTFILEFEADGNFSSSDPKADRIIVYDRGAIRGSRKGNDQPITGSFTVNFRQFTDGAATKASLMDVLDGVGGASAWVKADTAHEEFNLDMVLTIEGTAHGDSADHTETFSSCIFSYEFAEGDLDTITVNYECMGGSIKTGPA